MSASLSHRGHVTVVAGAVALLALFFSPVSVASAQSNLEAIGFDAALELCGQGRFAEALIAAEAEGDPVRRARALFWVRQSAGDPRGADEAARAGLDLAPGDAWLLEQRARVAISLGDPIASARVVEFERAAEAADPATLERARRLRPEAERLELADAALERGLVRARWTGIVAATVAALLALALARPGKTAS